MCLALFQEGDVVFEGPIAGKPAPTVFASCTNPVGAGLPAMTFVQTLKTLRISAGFPAPVQPLLQQPYPWSSTH
ncbi:hypothetical protein C1893_08100 [Pseudomonas sp. MPR-ANC1]|nr:hypothetical protein C1893_08100 [Pseudomonas sp. MPR-ANC1]